MGTRGPIPKRDSERRRRNKPDHPTDTVKVGGGVRVPPADSTWHPRALTLYRSLRRSAQSRFYEPSDWEMAKYAMELLSLALRSSKPSAQSLAIVNSLLSNLLVTEGDRRRAGLEIERRQQEEPASVASIDEYRRQLRACE
jgi:hypothetical protein